MASASKSRPVVSVIESLNPASNEVIGTVPLQTASEVKESVARAHVAAEAWALRSHQQRQAELGAWRCNIAAHSEELAELIHQETGKPLADAMTEIFLALGHLQHAAKRAAKALQPHSVSSGLMANIKASISYHPLGVIAVIGPWNFPVVTPMGSIAYALAAGNAVVFKPSELTPLIGLKLVELSDGLFSVPDLLQVVTGDGTTGAALAKAEVNKISFTGSTATGKRVMVAAAERLTPVLLELGGNDAMIVCADADLERAAHDATYGAFMNAGQACISIERCYVVESIFEEFVDLAVKEANDVKWGEQIGPITLPSQVDIIRRHLEDAIAKGAKVLVGGPEGIRSNFVPATVLTDLNETMLIMKEETFGPVLPICKVATRKEAVDHVNESPLGLGAAVFAKTGARNMADKIRSGMTSINSVISFAAIPGLPFGGVGDSGFGRIHGDEGLREFSRSKATAEERFALPVNLLSFRVPDAYKRLGQAVSQVYGGGVVDKLLRKFRF